MVAAGLLLVLPPTRQFGAKLAIFPFLGAVTFHLSPLLGVSTPAGFANPKPLEVLADGGPFGASDFSPEMTTALFAIAVGGLILSIINAIVQRNA